VHLLLLLRLLSLLLLLEVCECFLGWAWFGIGFSWSWGSEKEKLLRYEESEIEGFVAPLCAAKGGKVHPCGDMIKAESFTLLIPFDLQKKR